MEKFLTPEIIMAVGVTESGWTYGYKNSKGEEVGVTTSYTGLVSCDSIQNTIGGKGL